MTTKIKILTLLMSALMVSNIFGYTIKGMNYVDNSYGTKVIVYHNNGKPLPYEKVVQDSIVLIELTDAVLDGISIPEITSAQISSFKCDKLDSKTVRLTFLKKSPEDVEIENNDNSLIIGFPAEFQKTLEVKDINVNDNLFELKMVSNGLVTYSVDRNGDTAVLKLKNVTTKETIKAPLELDSDYFRSVTFEEKGNDLWIYVDSEISNLDSKVIVENNELIFMVGEAVESAQEMEAQADEVAPEERKYAFVTKTIADGGNKYYGDKVTIDIKDIDIKDLLRYIAEHAELNLIADESVMGTATYKFNNVPWDQALDIILKDKGLGSVLENGILRVATMEKFRKEEEEARRLKEEKEMTVEMTTISKALSYAKVGAVEKIIKDNLSARGKMMIDERTNTMIITDIPEKMPAIIELIETLDKATEQVIIEARIVETKKTYAKEFGIQWGFSGLYDSSLGTQTGMSFPNSIGFGGTLGGYAVNMPAINQNAGFGISLGNVLGSFSLDMALSAMESDGIGRILNRPRIITQNNKTAKIESGQRIPIQTIQNNTVTVKYINASLELKVTPQITAEGTIIMDVDVKKEEPDWTHVVDGNPTIITRNASTQVLVKDGGTTVIGGILHVFDQNANDYVPGFKNIPGLRWLFSHKSQNVDNDELLIFITPKITKY